MGRHTATHATFVHHDFKNRKPSTDKHIRELIVECTGCDWIENGFTRRPDAKTAGARHEGEANHA